jgi:carnitine-CoA ligase
MTDSPVRGYPNDPERNVTELTLPEPYHFADLPKLVGQRFVGNTFVIEASERQAFETVTWIDKAYVDGHPPEFPADIIEGFHSLALLDAIQKTAFRSSPTESYGFNYGLNRVRFPSQMFIGDRIVPTFVVRSVERRGPGFLVVTDCELRVEGAEKPGLVAEWVGLVLPREGYELDPAPGR